MAVVHRLSEAAEFHRVVEQRVLQLPYVAVVHSVTVLPEILDFGVLQLPATENAGHC